jgi:hypothetical protein
MKKLFYSIISILLICSGLTAQTNDFYDDAPTNPLKGAKKIVVTGEVQK